MTHVTVIFDAVLPEISYGELLSDDHSGSEDHHEADAYHAPSRVIQGQRVIEHWNRKHGNLELH